MPESHWKRLATSSALLAGMVLLAGIVLALIGATVFPQSGMFAGAAIVLLVFLLFQLAMFRLFGLRSRADEQATDPRTRAGRDAEATPAASGDPADGKATRDPAVTQHASRTAPAASTADSAHGDREDDADWRAWRG